MIYFNPPRNDMPLVYIEMDGTLLQSAGSGRPHCMYSTRFVDALCTPCIALDIRAKRKPIMIK